MRVETTVFAEVKLITPRRFDDRRGFFAEVYNRDAYRRAGIAADFVQDNHSFSAAVGTVRGLHFQNPPAAQDKLVWCPAGAVLDVVVDIRDGSPTYGRHLAVELSAANGRQLFVPQGFAHGFCTLTPDSQVFYKVSAYYSSDHDRGLLWNDPALAIAWPIAEDAAVVSEKDAVNPPLAALGQPFRC